MKLFDLINKSIFAVSLIVGLVSCEKNNTDLINDEFNKVYGEWISIKKCGGISGDCYAFDGYTLNIIEYNEFEIVNQQGKCNKGFLKVISQDIATLKVRFVVKKAEFPLFSTDELLVTFNGNDTIIFNEGCCDRFSFEFMRNK